MTAKGLTAGLTAKGCPLTLHAHVCSCQYNICTHIINTVEKNNKSLLGKRRESEIWGTCFMPLRLGIRNFRERKMKYFHWEKGHYNETIPTLQSSTDLAVPRFMATLQ